MQRVAIIMAGGSGERFWPVSRQHHPKQLLCLSSPTKTMLHEAVERLTPLITPEHIYVQTMGHLVEPIRAANVGVPAENVIAEPSKRNTAGCLIYAAAHMLAKYQCAPEALCMAIVTADHIIGDVNAFRTVIDTALSAAEGSNALVTIGVPPTHPSTGFGYIQASPSTQGSALTFQAFHEKPQLARARAFVASGDHYWNSGMFFWRISSFLGELETAQPHMAHVLRDLVVALRENASEARSIFETLDSISIDYALMEKAKHVVMIPSTFPWDDLGSWDALERSREADAAGNVAHGDPVLVDTRNSIVYNAEGPEAMAVSVVGMENVVVVVTRDAVLVVPKDRAEEVRKAVQMLQARGAAHL